MQFIVVRCSVLDCICSLLLYCCVKSIALFSIALYFNACCLYFLLLSCYMPVSATIVHSWSSHLKNAQLQKYTVFYQLAVSSPTLINRLVTTISLRFQVGLILIISTRRNAYVTVTVTLVGI